MEFFIQGFHWQYDSYRNITVGICLNFCFVMWPLTWYKSVPWLYLLSHNAVLLPQLMAQVLNVRSDQVINFIYLSLMYILQAIFHELELSLWTIYSLIWNYIRLGNTDVFQKAPASISPLGSHLLDGNVIQIHTKLLISEMLQSII